MRICVILPLVVVCLIGCGGSPSLVGKWSMSGNIKMPPGTKATIEFTADKFTQSNDIPLMGISVHMDEIGNYTLDGGKLSMTVTEVKLDQSKVPDQYRQIAAAQSEAAKGPREVIEANIDTDTVTLNQKAGIATLTRIK